MGNKTWRSEEKSKNWINRRCKQDYLNPPYPGWGARVGFIYHEFFFFDIEIVMAQMNIENIKGSKPWTHPWIEIKTWSYREKYRTLKKIKMQTILSKSLSLGGKLELALEFLFLLMPILSLSHRHTHRHT